MWLDLVSVMPAQERFADLDAHTKSASARMVNPRAMASCRPSNSTLSQTTNDQRRASFVLPGKAIAIDVVSAFGGASRLSDDTAVQQYFLQQCPIEMAREEHLAVYSAPVAGRLDRHHAGCDVHPHTLARFGSWYDGRLTITIVLAVVREATDAVRLPSIFFQSSTHGESIRVE